MIYYCNKQTKNGVGEIDRKRNKKKERENARKKEKTNNEAGGNIIIEYISI